VVYVSCGPDTLARDLAYLTRRGYRMDSAVPVDMFPWTEHIEAVCCLTRQKKDFISVPYEPKNAE
jgi:23S rRNA (uracil1939-C5)-methyltransferase